MSDTHQKIINQTKMIAQIDSQIIIKIPINQEGLFVINALAKANIQTMATAMFETRQVLLSIIAGANYAPPHLSRISGDQFNKINQMLEVICINNLPLKLIVTAIKNVDQILSSAKFGTYANYYSQ